MRPTSKIIWLAILASVLLHAAAYLAFGWTWAPSSVPAGPAGVVSVDFIEPVVHEATVAAPRARKFKKKTAITPPTEPAATAPGRETKIAPVAAARGGGGTNETGILVAEITRLINEKKSYPRAALSRELEGRVVVAITLGRDGDLLKAVVEEPSPYPLLDAAALDAVRMVRRFPPLPPSAGETLHLHVPIVFKISRR